MRAAFAFATALIAAAQEPGFQVQSSLVLVPVTVTDSKGRSVENLGLDRFTLLDDGKPRPVTVDTFATGVAPIALVVAVQSAGISAPVLDKVRKIGSMIQPLVTGARGCAGLVAFDERVTWLQTCTRDVDALSRAFATLRPGEDKKARMLDAVSEAVRKLAARADSRKVLLLISESRDRGSETELQAAIVDAQAAGVAVYAATYSAFRTAFTTKPQQKVDPVDPRRQRQSPSLVNPPIPPPEQRLDILGGIGELIRLGKANDAQIMTASTGGSILPFTTQKGLEQTIVKLGEEMHTQYVLSFVPESAALGAHRIEVRIKDGENLRVRARPTYWATR